MALYPFRPREHLELENYNKVSLIILIYTCINVLFKFAYVIILKDMTGKSLVAAFKIPFKSGRILIWLQTDQGTEFTNRLIVPDLFDESQLSFQLFTTQNTKKLKLVSSNVSTVHSRPRCGYISRIKKP